MVTSVSVPLDTRAPTGQTNAYLLGPAGGLLVDPPARSAALDAAVERQDPAHVAVTHHHPDHVGAVADYATEYDLTAWCLAGQTADFEAATGIAPDRTFGPGQTFPVPDGIRAIDTPGHAPEHVAFVTGDGLVAGDLAIAEGSVVVGAPEGDMRAYLSSLRRLHAMDPDRLYPGHGPVIDDPRATARRLVHHRLDREGRVLAAVRDGHRELDAIVDTAYDKDVSHVRDLATATVAAHLEKLDVEGRVDWDGEIAIS
ncbi:MBL fold metallo-hydrolase [Halobacteriales archaeon Cl-PHB]